MQKQNIHIEFRGLWHKMPIDKHECLIFFKKVCALQQLDNISFEILACDDKKSKELNALYLNMPSPTNILSFPFFSEEKEDFSFIGSLALSLDTMQREAFLYQQDLDSYAKQLLIHGFAHLLGFDHGDDMDKFCHSSLYFAQ